MTEQINPSHRFDGDTSIRGTLDVSRILIAGQELEDYLVIPESDTPDSLLTWPPPETDSPIELTISAAISLATSSSILQFAVNANASVRGSGPGGAGGGISGCTVELTDMGVGGAVAFEKSVDGSAWTALTVTSLADGVTTATTASATGGWFFANASQQYVRVRATALTSGTITGSIHGNNCTGLQANQDYIIYCPVPITLNYPNIGAVKFSGGRHIVWIGGETNTPYQNLSSTDPYSRAIYTEYCSGVFHMEGLYLHGIDLSDGFQLYSPEAIIQIQNCRVGDADEPITAHNLSTFSDKHPDIIEGEGGWRELRVDKLTGWSNYQGIFLNQVKTKHGRFNTLKRVDINGAVDGVPTGSRQLFWQGDDSGRTQIEEFYIQPHTEKTSLNKWNTLFTSCRYYGTTAESDANRRAQVYLPTGLSGTTSADSPTSSRWIEETYWLPKAAVTGHAKLGPPPAGEWVPDGVAGCAYKPIGYQHIDEAKMLEQVSSPLSQGRAIRPSTNKLKLWSMDPAICATSTAPPVSGTIYLTKLPIEETIYETTGFVVNVDVAGVSLTASQCWMALYDRLGNKMATSADLSTTFNSTGQKSVVLTDVSPYTPMASYLVGGYAEFCFAAMLFNWSGSGPKFPAAYDSAGSDADSNIRALAFNSGVDGTGAGLGPTGKFVIRFQKNLAAQTTLPAVLFFSNSKPSNFAPLVGFN